MSSQVWSHNVCLCFAVFTATLAGQPRGAQKECRQIQENQPQAAGGQETSNEEGDEELSRPSEMMNLTACAFPFDIYSEIMFYIASVLR